MSDLGHRTIGTIAGALSVLLLAAGSASAAWEPAQQVDNPGASTGATADYAAVADGSNGESTAYFIQTVGTNNLGYAIRRGASDTSWSAPHPVAFPTTQTVGSLNPLSEAADSSGNALAVNEQTVGGFDGVDASAWPVGGAAPGRYALLMSSSGSDVTDPQVAFDRTGNGYAVAGAGEGAMSDEPILLSTYSDGTWSSAAPIKVQVNPASSTCPAGTPAGEICGLEPRLAVSPDGTVAVVYLRTIAGQIPMTTQKELFGVRAPAGTVAKPGGADSFINEVQITKSGNQVPLGPAPGAPDTPPNFDVTIDGSDTATIVDAESQTGLTNQVFASRWPSGNVAPIAGVAISSAEPAPPASEPRLASDSAGDLTAMWTESGPNPALATLVAAELIGSSWTAPQSFPTSVDNPANPSGYPVDTPPFWLAEDGGGGAYAVWTSSGSLVTANRAVGKTWNPEAPITGMLSSAVPGSARVATGMTGQADALVVASNGTRNALFATRLAGPVTPQGVTPQPGPPAVPPGSKPQPLVPCNARPTLRLFPKRTRGTRKRIVVVGRASEHRCRFPDAATKQANRVVKVYVAIYHPAPLSRCRFLRRNGTLSPTIACNRPIKFLARGTQNWRLQLSPHVPAVPGGYLVRAWAVDGFGRQSVRGPASVTHLRLPKRKHKRHG